MPTDDPYHGLEIFRPPAPSPQSAIDQAQARTALERAERIKVFSQGRLSMFEAITTWLGTQMPGPGDQVNQLLALEGVRVAESNVQRDVAGWKITVRGWGIGIQSWRVLAGMPQNASNDELKGRLAFPIMPQALEAYAESNGL